MSRRSLLAAAGAAGMLGSFPSRVVAQSAPPQATLIRGARIFDGRSPDPITNRDVLVENGLIAQIGQRVSAPDGARELDADGRTLMPGLIDMHWHSIFANIPMDVGLASDFAYLVLVGVDANRDALMRGFTTVRDVGGNVFPLVRATDEGRILGPRIYPSGPYIGQTSGHGDFRSVNAVPAPPGGKWDYLAQEGISLLADGVPEVMQRTREALRMGATQIKAMAGGGVSSLYDPLDVTQFTFEEMKAIVDVAKTWNTYVTVHAFTDPAVSQSVEAGVACVEHGHLLGEATLEQMRDREVWLSMQPVLDDEDAIFPEGTNPVNRAKFVEVADGTEAVYRAAKELGLKIVFGTDTLFDPDLAARQGAQLAKLSRWFEPHEALAQATSLAGELCKLCGPRDPYSEGALGVIEEGAHADLILADGDPLESIDLVADPDANFSVIMKGGVAVKDRLSQPAQDRGPSTAG